MYLKNTDVPSNWINKRHILVVKFELLGVGLGEKDLADSTGWLFKIYDMTSSIVERWLSNTNDMGSLEDNDEILEDRNLSSVNYGVTSPIMVVMGFVAPKDVAGPNVTVMIFFTNL